MLEVEAEIFIIKLNIFSAVKFCTTCDKLLLIIPFYENVDRDCIPFSGIRNALCYENLVILFVDNNLIVYGLIELKLISCLAGSMKIL